MEMKLVKINTNQYVVVDDSEIKDGDYFLNENNTIESKIIVPKNSKYINKINNPKIVKKSLIKNNIWFIDSEKIETLSTFLIKIDELFLVKKE